LRKERGIPGASFEEFIAALKEIYVRYTPEYAERESGIPASQIVEVAREIGRAGSAFSSHVWRSAASGNLGGWQVSRALEFLNVLTGSIGTRGGTSPASWNKFVAVPFAQPEPQDEWNELLWPPEYPLAHHEMSFLLPYFLKEGRGLIHGWPRGLASLHVIRRERLQHPPDILRVDGLAGLLGNQPAGGQEEKKEGEDPLHMDDF